MTVSTITLYSGTVPNPFIQGASAFSTNAVDWTTYQANTLVSNINTSIGEFNADFVLVNDYKDAAAASASSASGFADDSETSAQASASSANYQGEWSTLTGAYNKGISVSNDGAFWRLNVDLMDITASEPSGSNSDWVFSSGTRWQEVTASTPLAANSQVTVYATVGAVDLTQPTFAKNDFIVVESDPSSTEIVRLLNPSNTLIGKKGVIAAGDNLVLEPGETVHFVARTSNILKAV